VNLIRKDQENISLDHYLQVIDKSIHRLDQFITDIVHHSRNSRLDVEAQPVEFQKVIDEVWESLSFMDETNEVQLQCQIQQLGPFYTDLSRLSIVFSNILSNALRYRDKRKKSFVRIELVSNDSQATIRFIDNGIGIASEYLDKVFRMFFRASNESKGSGLGLYIVKNTLEKINGSIDIASDFGEGTTFTVRLVNLQPT
ncbi:MAG: sensor histidine kinase, partial [Bacteroidota bacterium]